MPTFQHFGLFFTPDHVRAARRDRDREPLRTAWDALLNQQPADPLAAAQRDGLRYRFNDDAEAGARTVAALTQHLSLNAVGEVYPVLSETIVLAQTFELVRDHPTFSPGAQSAWLERFAARVAELGVLPPDARHFEHMWGALLNVVAGVVLEDAGRLEAGAAIYRAAIEHDIRPEGYISQDVDGGDGGSLYRTILSLKALVLMAEAAAHVGLDLWGYNLRGVSVITAAAYPIYYYYYPDKWRWDSLQEDETRALFKAQGGFLEMVNHRARLRDIKLLLEDLRPLDDPDSDGLPTLSHGLAARRGLFG